ncbi:MAG: Asp-tRNA(Asn)/Glu-tRNA(Gln) amidotransferase subunit GatC [Chloroflexi bacterium]|nr:Asp-tRNA(Asn)/Glu-tRNA(Gln) amidotransferase subunit GatC [Chloroflexota bacterium]
MTISRQEVLHIARLARLGLAEAEVERLREQLSAILEHFAALAAVDTEGVPPTAQSIELQSIMAPDKVQPSLPQDDILANAPRRQEDCFRVKAVLE